MPADERDALTDPEGSAAADGRGVMRRGVRVVLGGIRRERRVFGIAVAGAAVYGTGTVGGGWLLGRITDEVLVPAFEAGEVTGRQVATAGGALAVVALLTAIGVIVRRVFAGMADFNLQAHYRREVTRQYLRLPLAWHHRHSSGRLLSVANADVEAMWRVMPPLPMALGVVVMLLVGAVSMIAADPLIGATALLVLPGVMIANAAYQRRVSPLVVSAQQLRAEVSGVAHESFEAATVVKTLGREQAETDRFAVSAGRLRDANVAAGRLRGLFDPVIEGLPTAGTLLVLGVGAWQVSRGAAGTGDVVQIAYLLTLLGFPVRALGWVLGELPRTVVGAERVGAVLGAGGSMTYGSGSLPGAGPARLRAERLDYAYETAGGGRAPVLHGVTLDVAPGRTVAVVGPTGSGKSTLSSLLVRLVDPAGGRVLVEGVDARELAAGRMAEAAALVPQGTFVFDDSVRGNVTLGAAELAGGPVDDEAVWRALRLVRADGFVAALPAGLDTQVGERGTSLSGGQRQRLALARAVIRRPRLLVLDDATSAIDPTVEAEILAGLREAAERTTVVVVAYRRATIALADEVVYVEQGRVLDRGPHAEVLARTEGYRRLVTAYDRDGEGDDERDGEREAAEEMA